MIDLNLISLSVACSIQAELEKIGKPTPNRVVVAISKDENKTKSGLIIPGSAIEELPKKGVIVQFGPVTEEYDAYKDSIQIGSIINYGLYAGKELELQNTALPENMRLMALSINEIIYIESNKQ